jgi:hypothetical protein
MPRYDYHCSSCAWQGELSHSIADCDKSYQCPAPVVRPSGTVPCSAELSREPSSGTGAMMDRKFAMKAITADGQRVPGHFGAPRRGKYTPGY